MQKTYIYFVRHCESDNTFREDTVRPLTPKGLRDAKRVTNALQDRNISRIYSSPYIRAVDTVKDLAETLGQSIIKIDNFRERNVGGWVDDFRGYSRIQWADFSFKNPGGESLGEVQQRNIDALNTVLADNKGLSIAVGTHGTALSTIINHFDPSFGYDDFWVIVDKMPYILCFEFTGNTLDNIEEIALGEETIL